MMVAWSQLFEFYSQSTPYTCRDVIHPSSSSCASTFFKGSRTTVMNAIKIYAVVHGLSALLTSKNKIDYFQSRNGFLSDMMHSVGFLSTHTVIMFPIVCFTTRTLGYFPTILPFIIGTICGICAIYMEKPGRRVLISVYVWSVVAEALARLAARNGVLNLPNFFDKRFLFAVAVLFFYASKRINEKTVEVLWKEGLQKPAKSTIGDAFLQIIDGTFVQKNFGYRPTVIAKLPPVLNKTATSLSLGFIIDCVLWISRNFGNLRKGRITAATKAFRMPLTKMFGVMTFIFTMLKRFWGSRKSPFALPSCYFNAAFVGSLVAPRSPVPVVWMFFKSLHQMYNALSNHDFVLKTKSVPRVKHFAEVSYALLMGLVANALFFHFNDLSGSYQKLINNSTAHLAFKINTRVFDQALSVFNVP